MSKEKVKTTHSIDDISAIGDRSAISNLNRREFLAAGAGIGALFLPGENAAAQTSTRNEKQMSERHNSKINFLAEYSTTILESAIALIAGTHGSTQLTRPGLVQRFPLDKTLVGYAVTSTFSIDPNDARGKRENIDYWNYVFKQPEPKIAVSVDASRQPATGSSWGQLNAHIHHGLGCRGVLTNGGVRDIKVFQKLNFAVYSGALVVEHGNPHFLNFGEPIELYGATFRTNDIVCADEHGAIIIPAEILPNIAEAAAEVERRVQLVADYCQSPNFNPQGLLEATGKMKPANTWKPSGNNN